jgi:hypothetical protein
VQEDLVVLCEHKTHSLARVICVAAPQVMTAAGPAAGGFAICAPLPATMWGPDLAVRISLRRVSVPTEAEEAAAMAKEAAKLPAKIQMLTKSLQQASFNIDAGRKFPSSTLEARERARSLLASFLGLFLPSFLACLLACFLACLLACVLHASVCWHEIFWRTRCQRSFPEPPCAVGVPQHRQ